MSMEITAEQRTSANKAIQKACRIVLIMDGLPFCTAKLNGRGGLGLCDKNCREQYLKVYASENHNE